MSPSFASYMSHLRPSGIAEALQLLERGGLRTVVSDAGGAAFEQNV